MNDSTPPPKAKRGGKKGCKIDLLQLTSGGSGGQYCQNDCSEWNFEKKESDNSSIDLYSMSSYSSVDDLEDYDEMESDCITDMKGARILPIEKVAKAIREEMCCRRCALNGHKKYMNDFISFTIEYKEEVKKKKAKELFSSRSNQIKWDLEHQKTTQELYSMFCGKSKERSIEDPIVSPFAIREETYGFATSLFGVCGKKTRPHVFQVDADKIIAHIREGMHKNARAKRLAMNYRVAAAMQ